ncbi:MAG: hypothetical protein DCC75_02215 [Proteobacteria bacterium]|nr:MAG: hypothetical protein DCC75_02215 [Pseudomonadota bacterium]
MKPFLTIILCLGAILAAILPTQAYSAVTAQVNCDIDQDSIEETVFILGNRRARVTLSSNGRTKKVNFFKRYPASKWVPSCADENDDDKLDLILTNTNNNRTKEFFFFQGDTDLTGCGSVRSWPGNLIYKTIGSSHFSSGDPRRNAVNVIAEWGYRGFDSCIEVLAANGERLGQMGYYGSWSGGPYRWYGPTGCGNLGISGASLASRARREAGSSNIYVKIGNICYGPIDSSRCLGSRSC